MWRLLPAAVVAVVVPPAIGLGLLVGRAASGTWVLEAPTAFRRLLPTPSSLAGRSHR